MPSRCLFGVGEGALDVRQLYQAGLSQVVTSQQGGSEEGVGLSPSRLGRRHGNTFQDLRYALQDPGNEGSTRSQTRLIYMLTFRATDHKKHRPHGYIHPPSEEKQEDPGPQYK